MKNVIVLNDSLLDENYKHDNQNQDFINLKFNLENFVNDFIDENFINSCYFENLDFKHDLKDYPFTQTKKKIVKILSDFRDRIFTFHSIDELIIYYENSSFDCNLQDIIKNDLYMHTELKKAVKYFRMSLYFLLNKQYTDKSYFDFCRNIKN